jgi:hypothetical protein
MRPLPGIIIALIAVVVLLAVPQVPEIVHALGGVR